MEDVVIDFLGALFGHALRLPILSHQDETAEGLGHEELLQHGDHITDAAQISDACVAELRSGFVIAVEVGREAVTGCPVG